MVPEQQAQPGRPAQPDPYNLRLTRQDSLCLSGVTIPPGLVGFCHETPISSELLIRQAPELATIQQLLHELRLRTGLLGTFEVVERYRRFANQWWLPAAVAREEVASEEVTREAVPREEEKQEL